MGEETAKQLFNQMVENVFAHCGFCSKKKDAVKVLIKGVSCYICDECVLACMGMLAEMGINPAQGEEGENG